MEQEVTSYVWRREYRTSVNYNFSLQQIIHKTLKIRDGSTINFPIKDPLMPYMDINDPHLDRNIGDLDQSLKLSKMCQLRLNLRDSSPSISFDLIPNPNE